MRVYTCVLRSRDNTIDGNGGDVCYNKRNLTDCAKKYNI